MNASVYILGMCLSVLGGWIFTGGCIYVATLGERSSMYAIIVDVYEWTFFRFTFLRGRLPVNANLCNFW